MDDTSGVTLPEQNHNCCGLMKLDTNGPDTRYAVHRHMELPVFITFRMVCGSVRYYAAFSVTLGVGDAGCDFDHALARPQEHVVENIYRLLSG